LAQVTGNAKAQVLADTLDAATARFLDENKSPSRRAGEIDNRGSHYFLAQYWARALAEQDSDADLAAKFGPVADALESQQATIEAELLAPQGSPADVGGYYQPVPAMADAAMRPSATLNAIIDGIA
ncbi:MAG: NADP-dependent isocitrate dehydrogenase, partial [Microthrixaceae bacterium]|nr:NADP-dependent isocitrate dehydrogenase [Microthrixaceae bacterium]